MVIRAFSKKTFSTTFIVQNISNKDIRVFNLKISPGFSRDLMQIPYVYENDIKASAMNGELYNKLLAGELVITETNIDIFVQDESFANFLISNGINSTSINKIRNLNIDGSVKAGKILSLSETTQTTNATLKTISTFDSETTENLFDVFAIFLGEKSDGTQRIRFKRSASFNLHNGILTQVEDTATVGDDLNVGSVSWSVNITLSSNNIVFTVTGAGSTTIDWSLECTIIQSNS